MYDLVIDESFDSEKSHENILSIQVSLDGFSFSVISPRNNKLLVFNNTSLKISNDSLIARRFKEWINSIDMLKLPYAKIRVIVFNDKFSLIPEEYFSKDLNRYIPGYLFSEEKELETAQIVVSEFSSRLFFSLPKGLNKVIKEQLGECIVDHPVKVVLNQFIQIDKRDALMVIFDAKNFYILYHEKNNLQLVNSFRRSHANDVIFYILSALKQLKRKARLVDILYAGNVIDEDETISLLKKYFRSAERLVPARPLIFGNIQTEPTFDQSLTLYH